MSGRCGGTTRVGILIGGAAVGAFLMVTLGLVFCLVIKKSKLMTQSRRSRHLYETSGITIPIYPYKDMEKATDFFSEKRRLGWGAHGTVYSGWINREWVAVKRILCRHEPAGTTDQVLNEIRLVSSVSHPNLVRLLGCSLDHPDEHVLIYEFMPKGTLAHHLQPGPGRPSLPWPIRLTVAAETAAAVAYLHDGSSSRPPIYHRDVKSSNILLDAAWRAKVADFGLSRPGPEESYSHVSTAPQGTPGYVDPQYHQSFRLSDRSDVYSFGVVLAEIITGMRAVDLRRPQEEVNLAAVAADRIGRGRLDEIVDPFLKEEMAGDEWTREAVGRVAELAFRCLAWSGDTRPAMAEVARELEGIRVSRWIAAEMGPPMTAAAFPPPRLSTSLSDISGRRAEGGDSGDGGPGMVFSSENSGGDTWHSEESSPSSSSLLNRAARVGF